VPSLVILTTSKAIGYYLTKEEREIIREVSITSIKIKVTQQEPSMLRNHVKG
jgi:hypothetical protein